MNFSWREIFVIFLKHYVFLVFLTNKLLQLPLQPFVYGDSVVKIFKCSMLLKILEFEVIQKHANFNFFP